LESRAKGSRSRADLLDVRCGLSGLEFCFRVYILHSDSRGAIFQQQKRRGSGFWGSGLRFGVLGLRFWVWFGFWVLGFGFWVLGFAFGG